MSISQQTIKAPVSLEGVGLHTGDEVKLTFIPAATEHGYKFQRVDLPGKPLVDCDVDNVVDVTRGTTLANNGVKIGTVEHIMAALVGLQIDNVLIEINGPEVPIMDGSSKMFIDVLLKTGIVRQDAVRKYLELPENISFKDDDNKVEIVAIPSDEYQVKVMIDYNSKVLGSQHASVEHISDFASEIASSRTFCFLHELEELVADNLIRGGDLNNAIVVVDREVKNQELSRLAKMFNRPEVQVKKEGILNNVKLHYANEPARHKLLDVIGDLSLIGMPLKAKIIASRPGHAANIAFAKKVKAYFRKKNHVDVPSYDMNKPPIYDVKMIEKSLPHKYPFLFVDKIIELSEKHVIGVKNVTFDEFFFQGHFPGNPIMPGVLQIEALAQTGGILALQSVPDPENYETLFLKIDRARFKSIVIPGDTLILKLELTSHIRRGIFAMKGTAYVGNRIAAEAELVAQVNRKQGA